ncbi:39S ribosomal protein L51, mitochondrial [Agyrium rufum]|nr:39S ribosomal protein L51, mitochondrial [Agyrium rufum]
MPVSALKVISTAQNGVGTFILQCKRLDFHYCDWAGSSDGMKAFLKYTLPQFARNNPSLHIHVSPRPNAHPIIRGSYINGREKVVCVRNLEKEQIIKKAELLRDASGEKLKRVKGGRAVQSSNENVRGIWSGVHTLSAEGSWGPLDGMTRKG